VEPHRYYGVTAVRRSLLDLLFGKAVTALSTLAATLLLARELRTDEYAAYVAFVAIVSLVALVSTAGIQQALARYLPELRQANRGREMYTLMFTGLVLQMLILLTVTGGVIGIGSTAAAAFGLTAWSALLPWYLAVGFVRHMVIVLSVTLESLLWQRTAQLSLAFGGLVKLAAIAWLTWQGGLDLVAVIALEFAGESIALLWLVGGLLWRWRTDPSRAAPGSGWWPESRRRVTAYGAWAFLHGMARGGTGSPTARLLAARLLNDFGVAAFGFADRLADLMRRFLPMRLFVGVVRPVINARYTATRDFSDIAALANLGVRINMVILGLGVALLVAVGAPLFGWLTAGKYPEAGALLAAFCVLLMVESVQGALELLANAVEENRALFRANAPLVVALMLAVPLALNFGPMGLVIARIAGFAGSTWMVIRALRKRGYRYELDLGHATLVTVYVAVSALAGSMVYEYSGSLVAGGSAAAAVYGLANWLRIPLDPTDITTLLRLRRSRARPATAD
jgi:O-antigen/teichoic acid export membrane protein